MRSDRGKITPLPPAYALRAAYFFTEAAFCFNTRFTIVASSIKNARVTLLSGAKDKM